MGKSAGAAWRKLPAVKFERPVPKISERQTADENCKKRQSLRTITHGDHGGRDTAQRARPAGRRYRKSRVILGT